MNLFEELGSIFRPIALYTLADEEPGATAKSVMAQLESSKATCVNRQVAFGRALDISSFRCIILGRSSPLKPKNGWGSLVSQAEKRPRLIDGL